MHRDAHIRTQRHMDASRRTHSQPDAHDAHGHTYARRGTWMHLDGRTRANTDPHRRTQTHTDAYRCTQTRPDAYRCTETHAEGHRRTHTHTDSHIRTHRHMDASR